MSLFTAFDITSSAMRAQRIRMNVASTNMANKDTTRTPEGGAYRRRDVVLTADPVRSKFGQKLHAAQNDSSKYYKVKVQDISISDEQFRLVHDPHHPDADENGYVQKPNVSELEEMMNIMSASRAYEANANILKTARQMAERAIRIGR